MANSDSRLGNDGLQEILLDDPEFLREIVERVVQGILEAEMETHIGAAPYERNKERRGQPTIGGSEAFSSERAFRHLWGTHEGRFATLLQLNGCSPS